MAVIDEWIAATNRFATSLATQAHGLSIVPPREIEGLRTAGQALLETLIGGLPLLSPCEVVNVVQQFDAVAEKLDATAAERLRPVRSLNNQVAADPGRPGSDRVGAGAQQFSGTAAGHSAS